MGWLNRLFNRLKSTIAPDPARKPKSNSTKAKAPPSASKDQDEYQKLLDEAGVDFELGQQVRERVTDWKSDEHGIVRGSKSVPVPGLGMFGLLSLSATLTPAAKGYHCDIKVACLPLAQQSTKEATTLDEAKRKTEES